MNILYYMNLGSDPTNEIFIKYDNILKVFKKYFNEKVFYIKYDYPPQSIKRLPSEKHQYIYIYYKYPGFNENNIPLNAECLMITLFENKTIILNYLKSNTDEPSICKISGVELLCLLYTVAKELEINIYIKCDASSKSYASKKNPYKEGEINLADYYILLKGVSWYGQYGYFSINHDAEFNYNDEVRNLSIFEYFNKGINREENDVQNIINYINNFYIKNNLNDPPITDKTPIKDVMKILDTIKRNEEKKGNLYLEDEVIKYIRLIIEQDVIKYDNIGLFLAIYNDDIIINPEIENIYKNLCGKLTITINTGGKKYMRRKKTIRKKLKKQKKKYTYKNKK